MGLIHQTIWSDLDAGKLVKGGGSPALLHRTLRHWLWLLGLRRRQGEVCPKTELEKIKMTEMTCAELIKEAAKIIYQVHDEVKDKMFELELSWVGEFTDGVHKRVPEDVLQNAERFAKSALEEDSDSDEDMS